MGRGEDNGMERTKLRKAERKGTMNGREEDELENCHKRRLRTGVKVSRRRDEKKSNVWFYLAIWLCIHVLWHFFNRKHNQECATKTLDEAVQL